MHTDLAQGEGHFLFASGSGCCCSPECTRGDHRQRESVNRVCLAEQALHATHNALLDAALRSVAPRRRATGKRGKVDE